MPVEIRELIIRAVVDDHRDKPRDPPEHKHGEGADTEAIVEECVRQVMRILKKTGER
jgi:hypothetical protein